MKVFQKRRLVILFVFIILIGCTFIDLKPSDDVDYKCPDCNVILISIDTLRADHLGVYGYERNTSANIDKLAENGVLFKNAYTQWPKTRQAFAALMTGTYGHTNGLMSKLRRRGIDPANILLAEVLKKKKYYNGAVVCNPNIYSDFGFNQGFDDYFEIRDSGSDLTLASISWLKKNKDKKFFFWVHYNKPHAPYVPEYNFNETFIKDQYYGNKTIELNKGTWDDIGGVPKFANLFNNTNLFYYISQYDGEIQYVDSEIGNLVEEIEKLGLLSNSILILTADHGESLGDHNYYFEHGRLPYDACSKVPLIILLPRTKHRVIESPVALIDIMPTVLDFLNIPTPSVVEGESLITLLTKGEHSKYVFTESGYANNYQISLRTKEWKLVYIPDKEDRAIMTNNEYELYNIKEDPNELVNLIDQNLSITLKLKKVLTEWKFFWENKPTYLKRKKRLKKKTKQNIRKKTIERLKALGYVD